MNSTVPVVITVGTILSMSLTITLMSQFRQRSWQQRINFFVCMLAVTSVIVLAISWGLWHETSTQSHKDAFVVVIRTAVIILIPSGITSFAAWRIGTTPTLAEIARRSCRRRP